MDFFGTKMNRAGKILMKRENSFMGNNEKVFLAANLKKLTKDKKIKFNSLANELNMNKSTLHNYLNGSIPHSVLALKKLADFFGVSLDALVFSTLDEHSPNSIKLIEGRYELIIHKKDHL